MTPKCLRNGSNGLEGLIDIPFKEIPGTLVVFMIGRSPLNLGATATVETKPMRSAPSYPDVIPKQKIIHAERRQVNGNEVAFLVKAYLPDIVVVESTIELESVLSEAAVEQKRRLTSECRRVLDEYSCDRTVDEDCSAFCVSAYRGDPELFLSLYGNRIAQLLKNEDVELDEEEVRTTLDVSLKYGKDDITIIDWDGAIIFDAGGDFQGDIELLEIANLQLLRSRILSKDLDNRLEKTLLLLRSPRKLPFFRTRDVRRVLKEIIEIRAQSILESGAVEHNIKLIGDWYSARLYSLISKKYHLEEWANDIREKLDMIEDVYTMASENFSLSYRAMIEFVILAGWFVLLLLYLGEYFLVTP
jgi:hypothetical protein